MFLYCKICEETREFFSSIASRRSSSFSAYRISWSRFSYALILIYCLYHGLLLWAMALVNVASLDSKLGASMVSVAPNILAHSKNTPTITRLIPFLLFVILL